MPCADHTDDNSELLQYESFLQRETPQRVRAHLDLNPLPCIRDVSESLRRELLQQIPKLVMEIQLDLFRTYKQSQPDTQPAHGVLGSSQLGAEAAHGPRPPDLPSSSRILGCGTDLGLDALHEGPSSRTSSGSILTNNSFGVPITPPIAGSPSHRGGGGEGSGSAQKMGSGAAVQTELSLGFDDLDFLGIFSDPAFAVPADADLDAALAAMLSTDVSAAGGYLQAPIE